MKIFLAGTASQEKNFDLLKKGSYYLESFYYIKPWQNELIKCSKMFMLDSGAFTFMGGFNFRNNGKGVDFWEYADRYADFINRNDVKKFFELDVDVCIGLNEVVELRKFLEKKTNKQPIPVWHSTRGKDDFIRCCDEYPYVALGGIVGGEWSAKGEKYIPWFISEAHKRGAKIHGLGFTKTRKLNEYHFDSVDSTTWINGAKFANVCTFDGRNISQTHYYGKRCIDTEALMKHNFEEWIKFQRYAEEYL